MTWQGSDGGGSGRDPNEETRADWDLPAPDVAPAPAAPPPPPATPPPTDPQTGYGQPGAVPPPGGVWAPPPGGAPVYGVPGAPAIRFAGALPRVLAWILDGLLVGIAAGLIAGIVGAMMGDPQLAAFVTTVVYMGLELLYFVGFWTSSGRSTPGMRLFNLQVGNAGDGRTLSMNQAVIRWVALGLPLQALSLLPPPASSLGAIAALWYLILLVSTLLSPTRQGLHDRAAGSAIVQPVGRDGPIVPCLVAAVLLIVILPLFSIVALIFLGGQVSTILSSVGTSI